MPFVDFRDLRAWQAGMDLACLAYDLAAILPAFERYELAAQMRQAAVAVPSNIAEGWGRRSRGDFVRFLRIANGSLRELQTQALLAVRLRHVEEPAATAVLAACDHEARLLTALERSLRRSS